MKYYHHINTFWNNKFLDEGLIYRKIKLYKTVRHLHKYLYDNYKLIDKNKAKSFIKKETDKYFQKGCVYFIGNKEQNVIKIGSTTRSSSRMNSIQTSCPHELFIFGLLETNNYFSIEKALHKRFKDYNLRGEWFEINDGIKDFINTKCVITSQMEGGILQT